MDTPPLHGPDHFDALFAVGDDPYRLRASWYEARKRALTIGCLPAPRFTSAYEPACAGGELTSLLARCCDHLLASDGSRHAVDAARERLRSLGNVEVRHAWLPAQWPHAAVHRFDLVVLSEFGYYLSADTLQQLAGRLLSTLGPDGVVLACHWRHPIDGCALDGDAVHAVLHDRLGLARLTELVERDVRITVWSRNSLSVAQREHRVDGRAAAAPTAAAG